MSLPLHLLTGFLGAGKSTVLARLLAVGTGERIAVLVNEVGELSIDHHLLQEVEDGVAVLASGCVCCTIHGELFVAIERAMRLDPDRILLETTGLADPAPILKGLGDHPRLKHQAHVAGVIAVVDAERGEALLEESEAEAQVEVADRIVLSKVDLAPGRVPALRDRLSAVAPAAEVIEAVHGQVDPAWLLRERPAEGIQARAQAERWLHHGPSSTLTRTLPLPESVNAETLLLALRLIVQLDGESLLRVKGIVRDRASGQHHLIQSVQQAVFPARALDPPPQGWTGSTLVLIARESGRGLMDRWTELLIEACDPARVSTPNRR